jgi:serine/threonine-protein kinase RsbW
MAVPLTFEVKPGTDDLAIVFSSTMEMIDKADAQVKSMLERKGLGKHSFIVRVVMREGLTNSVRHGNRFDASKLVRFYLRITESTLIMVIEDEGDGFDWRAIKSKSRNVLSDEFQPDHGRGFLIMGDYFDSCKYNDKGNILILEKNISS